MSKISDLPETLQPHVIQLITWGRERERLNASIMSAESQLARAVIELLPKPGEQLKTRRGEQLTVVEWKPSRSRYGGGCEVTLVARQKTANGEWGKPKDFALYRLAHDRPEIDLAFSVLGTGWWYFKSDEESAA